MLAKIKQWYADARENITWHNFKKFMKMIWEEPLMMIIVGSTGAIVCALLCLATSLWPTISLGFAIGYLVFYSVMMGGCLRIMWKFVAEAWGRQKDQVEGSVVRVMS